MKIKKFESYDSEYFSYEEIKELFIELIDVGYIFKEYGNMAQDGKYYFDLRKLFDELSLGYIEKGQVYGYNNLEKISKQISTALDTLGNIQERITKAGYSIAFELEFNFSASPGIFITCHMQSSEYDSED